MNLPKREQDKKIITFACHFPYNRIDIHILSVLYTRRQWLIICIKVQIMLDYFIRKSQS